MHHDKKWKIIKRVVIGLCAAWLCWLALPYIVLAVMLIASMTLPPGSQTEGEYYVERINASTNTYESEDYIHLWEDDTDIGGTLFRYSVADQTKEDLTGKEHIQGAAVRNELLYYEDATGYWRMNLATKEESLLPKEDVPAVEALLSPSCYDKTCEKIEEILYELCDAYMYTDFCYLDQSGARIIGITQMPLNARCRGIRLRQHYLRYDVLFSYDPQTETCEILYRKRNNRTRIIGYQDGEVYLFRKNKIYRQNLDSGKKEELAMIPESETYTFDWWKNYLLVLDHTKNELVEVVEINLD